MISYAITTQYPLNTYRQEEIRDIVRDIYRKTHVRKVEAITQRNQRQRDDMVSNQLLEILPRLLQLQEQHNRLLGPVTRLEQVIRLEHRLVLTMREPFKHSGRVEVPDVRPAHDVQTERSEDPEVDGRVHLLHEAGRLALAFDSAVHREGANELLHDELAREGQHDRVEGHERDVLLALAVHGRSAGVLGWLRVGEEDGAVHGVGRCRVDGIQRQQEHEDEQREQPGVLETGIGEPVEEGATAAFLRMCFAVLLFGHLLLPLLVRRARESVSGVISLTRRGGLGHVPCSDPARRAQSD